MTATTAIPKEAFPTSPSLAPDIKTQSDIAMAAACGADTKTPCHIPVRVGLFFDGTNNNLERDRNGERIDIRPLSTRTIKIATVSMTATVLLSTTAIIIDKNGEHV